MSLSAVRVPTSTLDQPTHGPHVAIASPVANREAGVRDTLISRRSSARVATGVADRADYFLGTGFAAGTGSGAGTGAGACTSATGFCFFTPLPAGVTVTGAPDVGGGGGVPSIV